MSLKKISQFNSREEFEAWKAKDRKWRAEYAKSGVSSGCIMTATCEECLNTFSSEDRGCLCITNNNFVCPECGHKNSSIFGAISRGDSTIIRLMFDENNGIEYYI